FRGAPAVAATEPSLCLPAAPPAADLDPPTACPEGQARAEANTDKARKLMTQARQAVRADNLDEAARLVRQVRELSPVKLEWWDDTPDRLETAIALAAARKGTSAQPDGPDVPAVWPVPPAPAPQTCWAHPVAEEVPPPAPALRALPEVEP